MGDTNRIFLAPCSNEHAQEHLQNTVVEGVERDVYRDHVDRDLGQRVPIWGTTEGMGERYAGKMREGDLVLFYTGDKCYRYSARVRRVEIDRPLSVDLWTGYESELRNDQSEAPWPYVIFLQDVRRVDIDSTHFHELLGDGIDYPINFRSVSDEKVRRIVDQYGSVDEFVRHWQRNPGPPESDLYEQAKSELHAVTQPPELTEPQQEYTEIRRRARSAAFREEVRELYDYTCAICGAERWTPAGHPEVEAAHIYPRSENGADDLRNGLALCKLHHWAFDSGWLSLDNGYEVLVKDRPNTTGYEDFVRLEGDRIRLPGDPQYYPARVFVREHRALHGFG